MIRKLIVLASAIFSLSAFADIQTWDVNQNPGSGFNNSVVINQDGVTLTVRAWSDTGVNGGGDDSLVERAKLMQYGGGLGALNRDEPDDSPNHSVDNVNHNPSYNSPDYDMISLEFSHAVNLSHIDIDWATDDGGSGNDGQADMSFAAYEGGGDPTLDSLLNGKTWSEIVTSFNGWSESLHNVSTSGYQAIGSTGIFSKFWLVGAYNNAFGNLHDYYNDGIKLDGLKTYKPNGGEVPSPGSWLLLLVGLLGIFRAQKQASH